MSKAEYSYPEDEFDVPSNPDVPRGVHRAPRSAWSRWWPFLLVLVLAPALAFVLVNLAARDGNLPALPGASSPASDSSGTPDDTASDGATSPTDTATETTPADQPSAAAPAMDTPVTVLNAAKISGLAGTQAEKLTAAGFTAVTTGNFTGTAPADSVVYYATEDLKATADLVAATLGLTTVTLSADDAGTGVSVVLTSKPGA
ncbi:LytR C-terminal domain-containing protein [Cellulomonas sp. ICMP 17802]|uniref:LytR C-terminal domain-containing protein n=1 Tax=Cellulomonas sp. ICMP 17802 TaxID=3239199 RepID=UPI00351BA6AF